MLEFFHFLCNYFTIKCNFNNLNLSHCYSNAAKHIKTMIVSALWGEGVGLLGEGGGGGLPVITACSFG